MLVRFRLGLVLSVAAATLGCVGPSLADVPRAQKAIVRAVDSQGESREALLRRLVEINSGTFNRAGVTDVGKALEAEFIGLGFRTRFLLMDAVSRAPHLVAERVGKRGKRVLLIGHMDTVFEPFSPFRQYVAHGDSASGPGSVDDKGGLVVMIAALKALKDAGQLDGSSITAFITADEEHPGDPVATTRADFIDAAKHADAALCFEAGVTIGSKDYASTSRRGATSWTVSATGHAAHSGGIFSESVGDGAIFELSRILSRFHDELREPEMSFSAGLALGGANIRIDPGGAGSVAGKSNIVPAEAKATGDIRALTPEQLARVKQRMTAIVAANLPGTTAEISFYDEYPPMAPSPANVALLQRYSDSSVALGLGAIDALDPMLRGAGDSAFVSPYVATISGLGARGEGSHTSGERVDLSSLPIQTKRAALMIFRLTHDSNR